MFNISQLSDAELKFWAAIIAGLATLLAAVIVSVAGGIISGRFARARDRQDRESQWRSHAIELTKLDLQRKLKCRSPNDTSRLRPSILDFLANYRDLTELGDKAAKDLYIEIREKRINPDPTQTQGETKQGPPLTSGYS